MATKQTARGPCFLLSGGSVQQNRNHWKWLWKTLKLQSPKITYIPSSCGYGEDQFQIFHGWVHGLSFKQLLYFPVDQQLSKQVIKKALDTDLIFLSSGNTFQFLRDLRRLKLLDALTQFSKKGGILAGSSAGAILLTPSIHSAQFPKSDRDENESQVTQLQSLNRVDFEFFPHYDGAKNADAALRTRSQSALGRPLIACPDGAAVYSHQEQVQFLGRCTLFQLGEKWKL